MATERPHKMLNFISIVSEAVFVEKSPGTLLGAKSPEKGRLKLNGN